MSKNTSAFIFKNIFFFYYFFATVQFLITFFVFDEPFLESILKALLFWVVGISGLVAFMMHWYQKTADIVAKKIGWQTGSPFQKEVAAADGAIGLLGVLCLFFSGDFWTATIIGYSFMLFMMGIVHVLDLKKRKNKSVYNAGAVLYLDLGKPVVMLVLLLLWKLGF